MHGDGNGGNGGPPRMSIPEALALMGEPRTPLDRHIRFTAETIADFFTAFSAVNRRCDLLQAEIDRLGDGAGNGVERSGRGLSKEAFELGEDLLDRIEVGRVFGKKQETSAHGLNGVSHGFSFMGAQIVEDDDVVGLKRRDEELFDVGEKSFAVDRTVEHAGRFDAVVAQRGQEGRSLPVAASCWFWSRSRR